MAVAPDLRAVDHVAEFRSHRRRRTEGSTACRSPCRGRRPCAGRSAGSDPPAPRRRRSSGCRRRRTPSLPESGCPSGDRRGSCREPSRRRRSRARTAARRPAGMAIDSGLMPTILSVPPHGAMVGMALVPAMPIMFSRTAISVYQSMAPQWLEPRTAAKATPISRRPVDRPPHGEGAADLAHGIAAVDDDRGAAIRDDGRLAARIDAVLRQLLDIVRNPQDAVRVDAAPVGMDERAAPAARHLRHSCRSAAKMAVTTRLQRLRRDPAVGGAPGIDGHLRTFRATGGRRRLRCRERACGVPFRRRRRRFRRPAELRRFHHPRLISPSSLGRHPVAAASRGDREPDRDDQHEAVEQRLDEERRAELVEAGDGDRQHGDRDQRAPYIGAARLDRGGAEQRAGEGGQQEFLADGALADAELRLQDEAGEGRDQTADDEGDASRSAVAEMPLSSAARGFSPRT